MHTGVFHDLDLTAQGRRLARLSVPFSIDRSPYFLYNDEGLDDGHIETAFRRMIGEIASERTPSPAL